MQATAAVLGPLAEQGMDLTSRAPVPTAGPGGRAPNLPARAPAAGVARFAASTVHQAVEAVGGAVGVARGGAVAFTGAATSAGLQARRTAQGVHVAGGAHVAGLVVAAIGEAHGARVTCRTLGVWFAHWSREDIAISAAHQCLEWMFDQ